MINIDGFHGLEHPNLMDFRLKKLEKALSPRPDGLRGTSAALDRKEIQPRSLSDGFHGARSTFRAARAFIVLFSLKVTNPRI